MIPDVIDCNGIYNVLMENKAHLRKNVVWCKLDFMYLIEISPKEYQSALDYNLSKFSIKGRHWLDILRGYWKKDVLQDLIPGGQWDKPARPVLDIMFNTSSNAVDVS